MVFSDRRRRLDVLTLGFLATLLLPVAAQAQIRTVLVSPVPGNGVASGTALLNALAGISSPSSSNRWLLKIEPGLYDIGSTTLTMRAWVDIEGSRHTRIIGVGRASIFDGVVVGASDAELRELTVVVDGNETDDAAVGLYLPFVTTRIDRVRVVARDGELATDGIFIRGGTPQLSDLEIVSSGGEFASGIVVDDSSSPLIENVEIEVSGGSDTNRGILIQDALEAGVPLLRDVRISAIGGEQAYGIVGRDKQNPPPITVQSCTIVTADASVENVGVVFTDGEGTIRLNACLIDSTGTASYGAWAKATGSNITISASEVSGDTSSISGSSGAVYANATLLKGGAAGTGSVCSGVSDESYAFYSTTCP